MRASPAFRPWIGDRYRDSVFGVRVEMAQRQAAADALVSGKGSPAP